MIEQLANLNPPPESVPINNLVAIPGTPLAKTEEVDNFDFIRTIAAARITMPKSYVRLSAGREAMSDEMQAMCFFAGANSIFYCDKLLTTSNSSANTDLALYISATTAAADHRARGHRPGLWRLRLNQVQTRAKRLHLPGR